MPLFSLLVTLLFPLTSWSLTLCEIEQSSTEQILQSPWIHQEVELKGFVYRLGDEWALARQPDLKSCCASLSRVRLSGEITPSPSRVVKVQGKFLAKLSYDKKGDKVALVHLVDCKMIQEQKTSSLFFIAVLFTGSLLLLGIKFWSKKS